MAHDGCDKFLARDLDRHLGHHAGREDASYDPFELVAGTQPHSLAQLGIATTTRIVAYCWRVVAG